MTPDEHIRQLLARYALVHDRLDVEGFLELFTDEGRYVSRGVEHAGQAALRIFISGVYDRRPPRHRMKHFYVNPVITFGSNEAHATTDFIAYECTGDGPWEINMIGQCLDTFVQRDGRWLIAEREIRPVQAVQA